MYFYIVVNGGIFSAFPFLPIGIAPPPTLVMLSNGATQIFIGGNFPPAPAPGTFPITSASCNGCNYAIATNPPCATPAPPQPATCFAADSLVRAHDGRLRTMKELALDEWVLAVSGGSETSEVVASRAEAWIHRNPNRRATFLRVETASGRVLKLTPNHFIYKREACSGDVKLVAPDEILREVPLTLAAEVRVGNCLFELEPMGDGFALMESEVVSVEEVEGVGVYSPMTPEGNLFVDDVLVSCLSNLDQPLLQRNFLTVRAEYTITSLIIAHVYF